MTSIPQRWWPGTLPTERLAWDSAVDARDAARRLGAARGQRGMIGTTPALVAASFSALDHLRVDGRAAQPWAPLSGFVATADGWVRTHANYPHHATALERALGAADRDALTSALATLTAVEAEERICAAGGIAAAVRQPEEWAQHPHQCASADEPWVSRSVSDERPAPVRGGSLPLEGVRVLDLTRVVACPMATQLLGFLGADVLRIDPPPTPELLDQYLAAGMGKRSIELDLGANRDTVEDLPAGADVQVLGHRPGSLDRFGLAPQALLESHPQLVVRTHSAWGETGPWTQRPGFDSIVQAASGIAVACCDHDPESAGGAATRPGGAAGGDGEGAHAARSPGVSASGADLRGQALTASVGGYGAASPGWS